MVQVKKDRIRECIEASALHVFAIKGYQEAKISDIAEKAGVSVGNIYRYYKNKEEIFNSVVPESLPAQMKYMIIGKIDAAKDGENAQSATLQDITGAFIRFILENREKLTIIFSGTRGTRFERLEAEMVDALLSAVRHIYPQKYDAYIQKYGNDDMPRLIYRNLFRLYGEVMKRDTDPAEAARELRQVNLYHFTGITTLFEA